MPYTVMSILPWLIKVIKLFVQNKFVILDKQKYWVIDYARTLANISSKIKYSDAKFTCTFEWPLSVISLSKHKYCICASWVHASLHNFFKSVFRLYRKTHGDWTHTEGEAGWTLTNQGHMDGIFNTEVPISWKFKNDVPSLS